MARVPLYKLAHARSGDKGDAANCGVIAYRQEWYPILRDYLTAERVADYFRGICTGPVERYELPNLWALNFILHGALGGVVLFPSSLMLRGKRLPRQC